MYLLSTFGGLALTRDDGSPVLGDAVQRRLVLLALAVDAGTRGLPRDRAIALLWPDADEERGRRSLNQLRYTLRRDLGAEPLIGTLSLRSDPALIHSDLEEFRLSVQRGDVDRAEELHAGPFLDGVPLGGGQELDEWAEHCRVTCRRSLEELLERAARAAAGNHRAAERRWRRLVALDPLSATYTVGLMETLSAAGDASGALVAAAEHEAVVRRELAVPPDASVAAVATRIRRATRSARSSGSGGVPVSPPAPLPAGPGGLQPAPSASPPAGTEGLPPTPSASPAVSRLRRRYAWGALGLALAVAGMGLVLRERDRAASPSTVAVLPFTVRGDPAYRYLGEGMVTLLSAKLDGAGVLRPVDGRAVLSLVRRHPGAPEDPAAAARVADRLGAGLYILGDIVEIGGRLRLTVTAYRAGRRGTAAQAGVEGRPEDLFGLVDSLASALLGGLGSRQASRLTRLAASTTSSLHALKAYLEGQELFREGRFLAAHEAFARAATDTTFALASYWLSVSGWWADQSEAILPASDRALRHSARLAERDRFLLQAWDTLLQGDAAESERLYRAVLGVEPENIHAATQLGEVLFHYRPRRGALLSGARPAFERVLELEPGDHGAVVHLARIAAREGRLAEVRRLLDPLSRSDSSGEYGLEARAVRAFSSKDPGEEARVLAELARSSDGRIWNEALYAWLIGNRPGARRILALLTAPARAPEVRGFGHAALAYLNLAEGRARAARAELDQAARFDSVAALEHRALILALPFLPAEAGEIAQLREQVRRWDARAPRRVGASHVGGVHDDAHPVLRAFLLGALSARLGDTAEIQRQAAALDAAGGPEDLRDYARQAATSLRAQALIARGRDAEAATLLAGSLRTDTRISRMGASPFYARGLERYLLAGALERLGRGAEADNWYASFLCQPLFDHVFLAPAALRRAALARDPREAAGYDNTARSLWQEADPELRAALPSRQGRPDQK